MFDRIYNRKKDKEDSRDHKYGLTAMVDNLPEVYDMRHLDGPIENQGAIGSCTSFATAGAFQFLQLVELRAKAPFDISPEEFSDAFTPVSKLFMYYNERMLEGTVDQDSGGQIRDIIKVVAQSGACPETMWPYDVAKFTHRPPAAAYETASSHKITQYARLTSLDDIKHALASGCPVVFGISVYESFESQAVAATGLVPMPNISTERYLGGHAICAVGYDDTKKCLIVRNSWGTSFGDKGYFYLPYDFVSNPSLAEDFWVVRK